MKIGYLMQEGVPDIRKKPPSGAANHVINIIRELQHAGHQVRLLANLDSRIWRSDDLENFELVEVRQMDQGLIRLTERVIRRIQYEFNFPYANFFESLRFSFACRRELVGFDVYFERMGWLGYGGGLAARWQNIPLVLEVNGDLLDEFASHGLEMSNSQYCLSTLLTKKAARRVSHTVATGEGWRKKYIERWGVNPSNTSVVENGSALVDILSRKDLRAFSNGMESDSVVRIVYCGGFEPWHGVPTLIRASRKSIKLGCNIHLTLIGSGSEQDLIKRLIQDLGLEKKISMIGYMAIEELARNLAQSDIGVSPYCGRVEYSGLKLLDYKSAGLVTIASGENNQPTVLDHGRTGWIVPPCDEEALCQAIHYLAKDHDLRRRMGQEARIESETLHSWHNTAKQLLDVFNHVKQNQNPA